MCMYVCEGLFSLMLGLDIRDSFRTRLDRVFLCADNKYKPTSISKHYFLWSCMVLRLT